MRNWHRMDRTAAVFLGVLAFAELSPALPHHPPPVLKWWLGGIAVTIGAAAIWVLVRRQVLGRRFEYLSLVLFFVAVQMLRAADGNGNAGFSPLLILAVVWCALYGNRLSIYLALAGVAAVQFGPLIAVGAPQYPATLWRRGVLWVVILGLVGVAARRLVTALREKTAALAASEAQFRTAFDDAPAGVALVGASGAQLGIYSQVNRALCALLGRSEDELVGRSVLEFTHPSDRPMTEQELLAPPDRPFPQRMEKRYLHSSGREVLASITYSRIESGPDGAPCFIVHVQDASLRRDANLRILGALEQEKQTADRLQRLEQIRAAIVGIVTSKIRSPLVGISAATERLTSDSDELTAQQASLVRDIGHHAGQLEAATADLVQLVESEDAQAEPVPEVIDLETVVRGAIESIRPIAQGRAQSLQVEVNLDGVQVTGQADQIDRVLMNLLDNAVKFTSPGGAIDAQARIRGDTVEIDVTDTGMGIESDEIDHIFDRFYRGRSATARAIPGTGLGLSIVKAIAEQQNGTIQVLSEPGAGSTFTFTLPLRTPNGRRESADPS